MRVYIAAPWAERNWAAFVAGTLEAKGHTITHDWWNFDPGKLGVQEDEAFLIKCAEDDYNAVVAADVFLLLNTQARGCETSGKAVETGIALYGHRVQGRPSRLIATGQRYTNIFQHLEDIEWFNSTEEAIAAIG
jgi:hypothetical protein